MLNIPLGDSGVSFLFLLFFGKKITNIIRERSVPISKMEFQR